MRSRRTSSGARSALTTGRSDPLGQGQIRVSQRPKLVEPVLVLSVGEDLGRRVQQHRHVRRWDRVHEDPAAHPRADAGAARASQQDVVPEAVIDDQSSTPPVVGGPRVAHPLPRDTSGEPSRGTRRPDLSRRGPCRPIAPESRTFARAQRPWSTCPLRLHPAMPPRGQARSTAVRTLVSRRSADRPIRRAPAPPRAPTAVRSSLPSFASGRQSPERARESTRAPSQPGGACASNQAASGPLV